jgi:Ca2+-transporting ATPase
MVLLDDNFATIVAAVEEGRVIYDNIRKFIRYLTSCNSGEILVMLIGPLLGMPLPLMPLQILWMNLVTDGLPALALGVEPAEPNTMRRKPYPPSEGIFARGMARDILWSGFLMGTLSLAVGFFYWRSNMETWQTMVFTTLTFAQLLLALALRSETDLFWRIGPLGNKPLIFAVLSTIVIQLLIVYVPVLNRIFETHPLRLIDVGIALGLSAVMFFAIEIEKVILKRRR